MIQKRILYLILFFISFPLVGYCQIETFLGVIGNTIVSFDAETGDAAVVQTISLSGVTELEYHPEEKRYYGVNRSSNSLFYIDLCSGNLETVANLSFSSGNAVTLAEAIAYDAVTGKMFVAASDQPGSFSSSILGELDINTGIITTIANINGTVDNEADALEVIDGELYAIDVDGSPSNLYRLNKNTATGTYIGSIGFNNVNDIAYDDVAGVLYGASPIENNLFTIDLSTGAGTEIGTTHSGAEFGGGGVGALAIGNGTCNSGCQIGDFPFSNGAEDVSPFGMDGTVFGATPVTENRDGTPQPAYQFDGNDHIEFGVDDRGVTDQVTVSAWVKTSSNKQYQTVVCKYDWQQEKGYMLVVNDGFAIFQGRSGNNEFHASGPTLTRINDGEWHFITGVVEGNSWRIYVDCALESENTYPYSSADLTVNTQLAVGRYYHPTHSDFNYFNGVIDDVTVSDCFNTECCIERDSIEAAVCPGETITLKGKDYTNPGIYHDTITTGSCDSIITITISAAPVLDVDLGNDTSICQGETLELNASPDYENYYWNDDPVGSDQNIFTVNAKGEYWVKVENEEGCTGSDTVEIVNVYPRPIVDAGPDTNICPGENVQLSASGGDSYKWLPGGEEQQVIDVSPENTTSYSVVAYSAHNCASIADEVTVQVNPLPSMPPFDNNYASHCFDNGPLQITATEGKSFKWYPSGETTQSILVQSQGTYSVEVFDLNGCSINGEIFIENKCEPGIYVPGAFSPDFDGVNDKLEVFGKNITDFEMKIFNRWGEIIFITTDRNIQWNGMYRGKPMSVGTYPWVIQYNHGENEPIRTVRGSVSLIR